jgi:hypothetical protein
MLWVTSFVDSGHLESVQTDDDAKQIYQNLLLVSVAIATLTTPFIWCAIDHPKVSLSYMMIALFGLRAMTCLFGYTTLETPNGFFAYLCTSSLLFSSGTSQLVVDTFYGKKIPSDIAGTLRGI